MRHLAELHGHPLTDATRVVNALGLIVDTVPEHVTEGVPELDRPLQDVRDILRVMDSVIRRRAEEAAEMSEVVHD